MITSPPPPIQKSQHTLPYKASLRRVIMRRHLANILCQLPNICWWRSLTPIKVRSAKPQRAWTSYPATPETTRRQCRRPVSSTFTRSLPVRTQCMMVAVPARLLID